MPLTRTVSILHLQLLHDIRLLDVRRWHTARACDCHRSQGLLAGSRGTHRFAADEEIPFLRAGETGLISDSNQLVYRLLLTQDAAAIRLVGFHFINIVPFMDKIMALMNPFMKKELTSILYLHNDINEFYKFVPQDMLPQDYGGPLEEINLCKGEACMELYNPHMTYISIDFRVVLSEATEQSPADARVRDASSGQREAASG